MKKIYQTKGMTTELLALFTLLVFFGNCGKDCKPERFNNNVNESYLPLIIPYSDTSTRLFLKNGKDTLLFKSLGLNRQIITDDDNVEGCDIYNLQNLTLIMAASDTDNFEINYYALRSNVSRLKFSINRTFTTQENSISNFKYYYPPTISLDILNTRYDTLNVYHTNNNLGTIYIKPKVGVVKFQTPSNVYELIK